MDVLSWRRCPCRVKGFGGNVGDWSFFLNNQRQDSGTYLSLNEDVERKVHLHHDGSPRSPVRCTSINPNWPWSVWWVGDKNVLAPTPPELRVCFCLSVGVNMFYICIIVYLYGDLAIYAAAVPISLMEVAWWVFVAVFVSPALFAPCPLPCLSQSPSELKTITCWSGGQCCWGLNRSIPSLLDTSLSHLLAQQGRQ